MFDIDGNIILDDDAAAIVNEKNGMINDRELASDIMKRARVVLKEKVLPNIDRISEKVLERIHASDIPDNLPETDIEPESTVEEEVRVYIIAMVEKWVENVWMKDLHKVLEMAMESMTQGGMMYNCAVNSNDMSFYESWMNKLVEYQDQVGEERKKFYEVALKEIVSILENEDLVINILSEDVRLAPVLLKAEKNNTVEIRMAQDDKVVSFPQAATE